MEKLFITVLKMSLISCYIIFFVLIVRLLLRKAPKIFSYVLWAIVFLKLICPATFESVVSLIPEQVSTQMIENTVIPEAAVDSKKIETPEKSSGTNNTKDIITEKKAKTEPAAASYLSGIWLVGIIAIIVYSIISYIKLKKRLSTAIYLRDNLYETTEIHTPFVMGIYRPGIYLPGELTKEESVYIIQHEQVHIQRRDYLVKIITFSISCIHWFNPLVWLSFILMNRDMEMSCDEKVIKKLGSNIKKGYSNSLLSLAADRKMPGGIPIAFGENNVKGRIRNVLDYKKPALWIILVSAVLVAAVCIGLFFNPSGGKDNYKDKKQPVGLKDFDISDSPVTLYDGTAASVKLILTEGTYYDEEYAGLGGGTYPENYAGNYELQLVNEGGDILSSMDLNDDWDNSEINFSGEFDVLFTDYNNDNCPDFTIGTYGSSNLDLYYLYTITEENKISRICRTEIADDTKKPSVVFEHETKDSQYRFYANYYNNAIVKTERIIYQWDADTGYFIVSEETGPDNGEAVKNPSDNLGDGNAYLVSMFGESHNYYFQSEYTGEDYDGDGLADHAASNPASGNRNIITVSFGNGDELNMTDLAGTAGNFKIAGADLNENGENEIIVIYNTGANGGDGIYGLAVYVKQGGAYEPIAPPDGYNIDEGFSYALNWDGKTATIFNDDLNKSETIENSLLEDHYFRMGLSEEWENLQGKPSDTIYADGVCDFVVDADAEIPALVLKQYLIGPTGVHVDCIGYMITELHLNKDNSWKIWNAYYLLSD